MPQRDSSCGRKGVLKMQIIYKIFLGVALVSGPYLLADVVPTNDFDVVEEDRLLSELQSGKLSHEADPKFVLFLTDIGSRLTLPQTYDSAIHDFALAVKNDQKWLESQTLRKVITGLSRKITYSCTPQSSHLHEVYSMLADLAGKYPVAERYRILSFMNKLDGMDQKKTAAETKALQKAADDAARDAEKQKAEQDKLAAKQQAAAQAASTTQLKEKMPKTPRTRTTKPRTAKDTGTATTDDATLSDDQRSVAPKKPRGRTRKASSDGSVDVAGAADSSVAADEATTSNRFDRPHEAFTSGVVSDGASDAGMTTATP